MYIAISHIYQHHHGEHSEQREYALELALERLIRASEADPSAGPKPELLQKADLVRYTLKAIKEMRR